MRQSIYKFSPTFVAAKCAACDCVVYAETDLDAAQLLHAHLCRGDRFRLRPIWHVGIDFPPRELWN
jgi:hypothetical protein